MTSISPLCLSKDDPFLLLLIQLFTPYIHTSDKMDVKEVVLDFRLIKLLSPACASALPITILFVPFMFLYIYTYDCLPRRYLYLTYIIKYRTHTNRKILDEKGSSIQISKEKSYIREGSTMAYYMVYYTYDMCTY